MGAVALAADRATLTVKGNSIITFFFSICFVFNLIQRSGEI